MTKRRVRYKDTLQETLTDPQEAASYLNAALEEQGTDAEEIFYLPCAMLLPYRGCRCPLRNPRSIKRASIGHYLLPAIPGCPHLGQFSQL